MAGMGLWLGAGTTVLPIRVVVRWRHRHTPDLEYCVTLHLFNSNNFVTSAALAEVCARLSVILALRCHKMLSLHVYRLVHRLF